MMKSTLTIATLAIVFSCGTAHAGHFSYETQATESKVIGGTGPAGAGYMGSHAKGTVTHTMADGSEMKGTWECVSMANSANSKIFDAHMACDVEDTDGTYSLVLGCQMMNEEGTETSCVGGSRGKTGAYKGKNGNFSQHQKDGKSTGSGQWFE